MNMSQKPKVRRHEDLITLIEAMNDSGKTDAVIATAAGVSPMTLYWWRQGKVRCGRHDTMANVASALGLQWRLLRSNLPAERSRR